MVMICGCTFIKKGFGVEMKKLSGKEFVELGLEQEINRRFLNPMGLNMEILKTSNANLCGRVLDFRDIDEGVLLEEISLERITSVESLLESKKNHRVNKHGWIIQPGIQTDQKNKGN